MTNKLPELLGKNSLIETIKSEKSTIANAMDTCFKELEFVKDVGEATTFGWAIKLFNIHSAYQANKLHRNVIAFLTETDKLSKGKRNTFYQKLQGDEEFSEKFAEVTLLIWHESETPIKAKIVGNLAYHLSIDDITNVEYLKYSMLVYSASVPALDSLSSYLIENNNKPNSMKHSIEQEPLLFSSGFGSRYGSGFNLSKDAINISKFGIDVKVIE